MKKTKENEEQNKLSFILYLDNEEIFNSLSDEDAGKLIKYIFHYVHTGETPDTEPLIKMAFIPIKQAFKRDLIKWRERADRSRENGSKGGRPKKPRPLSDNPENPVGYLETQSNPDEPRKPDSVNVSVNVNDSVNVSGNVIKKGFCKPTVQIIHDYMNEYGSKKHLNIDLLEEPENFYDFYESKGWVVGKVKMKDWKSCVRNWVRGSKNFNKTAKESISSW